MAPKTSRCDESAQAGRSAHTSAQHTQMWAQGRTRHASRTSGSVTRVNPPRCASHRPPTSFGPHPTQNARCNRIETSVADRLPPPFWQGVEGLEQPGRRQLQGCHFVATADGGSVVRGMRGGLLIVALEGTLAAPPIPAAKSWDVSGANKYSVAPPARRPLGMNSLCAISKSASAHLHSVRKAAASLHRPDAHVARRQLLEEDQRLGSTLRRRAPTRNLRPAEAGSGMPTVWPKPPEPAR